MYGKLFPKDHILTDHLLIVQGVETMLKTQYHSTYNGVL